MTKYRKIDPKIWNDRKFMSLSNKAKLVFLFGLTHPHMTAIGAMRASIPGLASELGWLEKDFSKAFDEALIKDMVKVDKTSSVIWYPRFLKYNKPESPNVVKAWIYSFDLLPECNLTSEIIIELKVYVKGLSKAFSEAFNLAFEKPLFNQEQEPEQEHKPKKDRSLKSIDLVKFKEQFIDIDVETEFKKFKDDLKKKGHTWKDYHAAFRNWLRQPWVPKIEENKKSELIEFYCENHPQNVKEFPKGSLKICRYEFDGIDICSSPLIEKVAERK